MTVMVCLKEQICYILKSSKKYINSMIYCQRKGYVMFWTSVACHYLVKGIGLELNGDTLYFRLKLCHSRVVPLAYHNTKEAPLRLYDTSMENYIYIPTIQI